MAAIGLSHTPLSHNDVEDTFRIVENDPVLFWQVLHSKRVKLKGW